MVHWQSGTTARSAQWGVGTESSFSLSLFIPIIFVDEHHRIRLYSTKSFKRLGILKYHKSAAQCLKFARAIENAVEVNSSHSEEDMDTEDKLERSRWLVAGSKDCRVSIWSLISFAK